MTSSRLGFLSRQHAAALDSLIDGDNLANPDYEMDPLADLLTPIRDFLLAQSDPVTQYVLLDGAGKPVTWIVDSRQEIPFTAVANTLGDLLHLAGEMECWPPTGAVRAQEVVMRELNQLENDELEDLKEM